MYKTDYIVKYHDIEEELLKRLEIRLATEAAAKITAAIESIFKNSSEHSNENIIINVEIGGNSNDSSGMHRIEILNSNKLKNTAEANTPTPTSDGNDTSDENVVISNNTEQQQYEEQVEEGGQSGGKEEGQQEEGQQEGQEEDDEEEYKYTREDVTYICEKLYRDELLSVFGAETLDDPEMDNGIKAIFEALINNDEFKQLLVDLNAVLLDPSKAKNETELANLKRNTDYLIFITLFSQQSFYLTHKCLCQMLTQGKVQPEMMDQLKQRTLKLFALA
jgi:hypothetical protein